MGHIKKPHKQPSRFKQYLETVKAKASENPDKGVFLISFRQIDRDQGQSFHDWENSHLLADAIETICGYSSLPLIQQLHNKFKIYPGFPPEEKTDFKFPKHVSTDARWASMHIKGEPCLIGHVVNNTFFLVFLDRYHKFYKSELRNT